MNVIEIYNEYNYAIGNLKELSLLMCDECDYFIEIATLYMNYLRECRFEGDDKYRLMQRLVDYVEMIRRSKEHGCDILNRAVCSLANDKSAFEWKAGVDIDDQGYYREINDFRELDMESIDPTDFNQTRDWFCYSHVFFDEICYIVKKIKTKSRDVIDIHFDEYNSETQMASSLLDYFLHIMDDTCRYLRHLTIRFVEDYEMFISEIIKNA